SSFSRLNSLLFFFSSRRRHTRFSRDWSSDVCSSDLERRSLDDLKGMQAAAGGQAQSKEIEALGGSAASVAYPELYESLQRGVVEIGRASGRGRVESAVVAGSASQ